MLEERIREWERKARREGRIQGVRETVIRLMMRRFGSVPRRVREQVKAISSQRELEGILDKVLAASSLQEIRFD
jgi:hypothetical protein